MTGIRHREYEREVAAAFLIKEFESKTPSIVELKQGILSPVGKKPPHKVMDAALVAI